MKRPARKLFDLCASTGVACVLFLLLFVLTFLGTVEQVQSGLYDVQQRYFHSLFVVHWAGGVVPLPLPGAYLLMTLLLVNLICGGIVRMRKDWARAGVLVTHVGIALLLVGGFVRARSAVEGHMTLYEGERADEFESYYEWEMAIAEVKAGGECTEYAIPGAEFAGTASGGSMTFVREELPFDLTVSGYARNAVPRPASGPMGGGARTVDGFYLEPLVAVKQAEQNIPGVYVTVRDHKTGGSHEAILWGMQRCPAVIESGGRRWAVDLRKVRRQLPFTIALDKFTRELHPRTSIPKVFMSEVTKIEDGASEQARISMNEPFRYRGYTFYQASWGPPNAQPGQPLYSTLAVVRNPAENAPLYASVVIVFGLGLHFGVRLWRHLRTEHLPGRPAGGAR
ncbi:MAG: cytochrome c biogenesis protein ResB [Candidatus Hydrogenedentes bacterium]|nr:cytochrome c biogenesis protein ResB [Candidatus Hydrogenedentota bacterium]